MLTPQDITNREFDKAVFGGYDISAVDKFLEEIFQDYSALYKDNATLKGKLKVLVDKVEEYRNTEDAMHLALLTAQKTAREMTEEAEKKAAEILQNAQTRADALQAQAEADAENRRQELKKDLQEEENALLNARRKTAAYLENLRKAGEAFQESLSDIYGFSEPLEELPPQPVRPEPEQVLPEPEESASEPEMSIDIEGVMQMIEETYKDGGSAPAPEEPREEHSLQIDYNNLQFGTGYDKNKKR